MATCKECYHTEVCTKHNRMVQIDEHTWDEYEQLDNVEKFCEHYTPTADVEEVRHGEWLDYSDKYDRGMDLRCSVCDKRASNFVGGTEDWWDSCEPNYCPNCGAKMDGGKAK